MTNELDPLALIAEQQVGLHEDPRGSNDGPDLKKFFLADTYDPRGPGDAGYPWCASFVSWCVQDFLRSPAGEKFSAINPPRTARAFGLIDWARNQERHCVIFSGAGCRLGLVWPRRGDIAVFGFSHCGIVLAAGTAVRAFTSVEGNTDEGGSPEGWEVARRPRFFADVKAFIRLQPKEERI